MSNAIIGALRVNLGLDAAQFQRGVAAAQGAAQSLAGRLRIISVAAAGAAAGLALAVRGQLNAADDMIKTADRIGLSVESLSQLEHAASLSGVSMQTFTGAMQRLARTAVESAADLHRLGVATRDSSGQMRPMEAILMDVADRLAAMPPGAERTALAIQLLGRSGAELIPMLQGGSAALRAMMAEADALGLTLSTRTARAAEQFNDNISRLQRQFTGITRMLMAELAPALAAISDGIVAAVSQFRAMSEAIGGFQGYIAAAAIAVSASFVPALYAATAATGAWISSLITLRGVLLATGIGAFVVGAGMAINWLIRLRESTGSWAEALGMLADVARGVWTAITDSALAIPPALNAIWARVNAGFNVMVRSIMDSWSGLMTYMRPGFDAVSFFVPGFRAVAQFADAAGTAIRANIDANIEAANAASERWGEIARANVDRGMGPLRAAMERIRLALSEAGDETVETTAAITALNNALRDTEAAGGGARAATDSVRDGMEQVTEAASEVEQSFESAFVGFLTGAKSAREAIADLLRDLARMAAQAAFRQLTEGMFSGGGFLASLFGGFRANGGPVMPSRAYVVGERGPEMFVPSSAGHIVPNDKMGGQGGGTMAITVNVQGANGDRHIETLVQQGVVAGIREYDRLLPDRIEQFTANQRRR